MLPHLPSLGTCYLVRKQALLFISSILQTTSSSPEYDAEDIYISFKLCQLDYRIPPMIERAAKHTAPHSPKA